MALSKSPIQTLFPAFNVLIPNANRLSFYYTTMSFTDDVLPEWSCGIQVVLSLSVVPKPWKPWMRIA